MAYVMVPFANGKGEVGKTAPGLQLRVTRPRRGDVILTDLNEEQRTALAWSAVRDHIAELDAGIAKDFGVSGDRTRRVAPNGPELGHEPAAPPLRGTLLVADKRDRDDIGGH